MHERMRLPVGSARSRQLISMLALTAWLVVMAYSPGLQALDYPAKPITIIVPFPPGGSNDVQARLIAKGLTERIGKAAVVDNRPGAGGRIGAGIAARAAPDGYTLFFASTATLAIEPALHINVGFDPLRDFVPITLILEMPLILVTSPSLPVKNAAELIALARKKSGELTYASAGPGSTLHLVGEMFKASNQLDIVHVPYKGEVAAGTDVLSGQVSMMFITPIAGLPQIRAGKLQALAVTGTKRMSALPQVPTLTELGIKGVEQLVWFALLAPAKTAPEITEFLHRHIVAVLKSPEFGKTMEEQGGFIVASNPRQLTERILSDTQTIAKTIRERKLKFEE